MYNNTKIPKEGRLPWEEEIPYNLRNFLKNAARDVDDGYEYASELNRILNSDNCQKSFSSREIEAPRDFTDAVRKSVHLSTCRGGRLLTMLGLKKLKGNTLAQEVYQDTSKKRQTARLNRSGRSEPAHDNQQHIQCGQHQVENYRNNYRPVGCYRQHIIFYTAYRRLHLIFARRGAPEKH